MRPLRIAIDPTLKRRFGPEICWTWRLLLSGMGVAWEEVVGKDVDCDIAYYQRGQRRGHYRFGIRTRLESWERRDDLRLAKVGQIGDWQYPMYETETSIPELFHAVNGAVICERDVIFDVFWLATGQEERHWEANRHGHVDLGETNEHAKQALRTALASGIGFRLQKTLEDLGLVKPVPRWPNGKRAAACVSHDVDYPEVVKWVEPLRIFKRQGVGGLGAAASVLKGTRHHWHVPSWVRLERSLNTHSAFYFVARQGSLLQYLFGTPDPFYEVCSQQFRTLFQYLTDQGFEIGMHASYRACESTEAFAKEKRVLEEATGQPIYGNRHHYWHLNPRDPESTLLMHEQIGLTYDTSLTHERYVGWRRGLCWPFFPFHQKARRELRTLQIPTAWMDDQLFSHQRDNVGDRLEILRALADRTAEQGGCLLIDVHDYVFDDVLFPGWAATYRWLWDYLISREDFWMETPSRIADHWCKRYLSIVEASQGLTAAEGYS